MSQRGQFLMSLDTRERPQAVRDLAAKKASHESVKILREVKPKLGVEI